jgi:hypothetical protein
MKVKGLAMKCGRFLAFFLFYTRRKVAKKITRFLMDNTCHDL